VDRVPINELPRAIHRMRDEAWLRRRELRLRTPGEARRFVRRVGLCLFWPTQGVEMPNLLQAIAGNARPLSAGYDDPAIGKSWNWKDESLDKRWWYYGKLLRHRATLVSLDLLPAFYALSENYGDPQDYLIEYQEGRLSAESKAVYEALLANGPLDAVRLRQESRLAATQAKSRFDRALVELQGGLKILPTGVAEAGAWRYAFVYDLVERWFPDLPSRARRIGTGQARRQIARQYVQSMIVADRSSIARALGWRPADVERTVGQLLEAREILEVILPDSGRPWFVSRRFAPRVKRITGVRNRPAPQRGRPQPRGR
jgi:hypothetical protein